MLPQTGVGHIDKRYTKDQLDHLCYTVTESSYLVVTPHPQFPMGAAGASPAVEATAEATWGSAKLNEKVH